MVILVVFFTVVVGLFRELVEGYRCLVVIEMLEFVEFVRNNYDNKNNNRYSWFVKFNNWNRN